MRPLLLAFFGLALFFSPATGFAASLAGNNCSDFGTTRMDDNKQDLVACLYNASGQLKWKATTGSADVSCTTGKAVVSVVNGIPQCNTAISDVTCPSGQAVVGFKNGVPQCGTAPSTEKTCGMAKTHYIGVYPNYKCYVDEDTFCQGKTIIGKCTSAASCPGYANWQMDTDCGGPSVCPSGYSVKTLRETIDKETAPAYITHWFTCFSSN